MKTCIFTIVSNNYLHYANTLFESVKTHCPEADLFLGLCDKAREETYCPNAQIIEMCDLNISHISRFIYQYSILELNTAIKPYVIEELMNQGYDAVIYIDPDIKLFSSLDPMLKLLEKHNVILTPHLTNLLDDGKLPNELGILQAGSYNLGYIGLANNSETKKLVKWWQDKLYKECVVDISRGLFVDQKWMDMVPSLFDGVYICRDEGWNVAYWNLNHRDIEEVAENEFEVNGRPLMFFHYSGYSIDAKTLSKHQNRFNKTDKGPALVKLCEIYNQCLTENGIGKYKQIEYAFSRFSDGVIVPDAARKIIKDEDFFNEVDFFDCKDMTKVHDFLNRKVKTVSKRTAISQISHELWKSRQDLRDAFPDVLAADSMRYVEWLLHASPKEAMFSDVYLTGLKDELDTFQKNDVVTVSNTQTISNHSKVMKALWNKRDWIPLSIRLKLGSDVASWVFSKAYSSQQTPLNISYGINLIGYIHAESGVGEAARSSFRAIRAAEIPSGVIDYRVGNVSRMSESIEGKVSGESNYGINLIHVNADQSKVVRDALGERCFAGKYNIGYWYWELPEFPAMFDFAFDQVDEIWVATEFILNAISAKTNKPVKLMPPNVQVSEFAEFDPSEYEISQDDFVFFHMSDVLSMPERKNPEGVLKAFEKAFGSYPEKNVKLLLKISNLERQPELESVIRDAANRDARIKVISGYLNRDKLNALMANINCYVSLHKAEGFGLPIAEAMNLGKVVIATMWSGNVDFMDQNNSLPIKYKLQKLEKTIGPYEKGQEWADPCLDDAAEKMYHLIEDTELQKAIGESAKITISERFSPESSGLAIKARLRELTGQK